jgi:tripeptide aminopeptidase
MTGGPREIVTGRQAIVRDTIDGKYAEMASVAERTLEADITRTLFALAGIPSVSGSEERVREYILRRLEPLLLCTTCDAAGNVIVRMPAADPGRDEEPPLLLCAHMDRVPPGLAHTPALHDGVLTSDGTTNLGADDSAGIALILHIVEQARLRGQGHPPLLLLFTVGEEVGLLGAKAFDPEAFGVRDGIVFDNAGEPGQVVTRAATYIAFDVTLHGKGGHPGKRLQNTASAIEMFHNARYLPPPGELDPDVTRISIGRIEGGSARNAVPVDVRVLGEVRTLLEGQAREELLAGIERAFLESAQALGGSAEVVFDAHCDGYSVGKREPLLRSWAATCRQRGRPLRTMTTFIGSDTSALRPATRAFTVSTGAMEEHTTSEWIATRPLVEIAETALTLLSSYR